MLRSKVQDFAAFGIKVHVTPSLSSNGTPASEEPNFPLGASSYVVNDDSQLQSSIVLLYDADLAKPQVAAIVLDLPREQVEWNSASFRDSVTMTAATTAEPRRPPKRARLQCAVTGNESNTCHLAHLIDHSYGAEKYKVIVASLAASWASAAAKTQDAETRAFYEAQSG